MTCNSDKDIQAELDAAIITNILEKTRAGLTWKPDDKHSRFPDYFSLKLDEYYFTLERDIPPGPSTHYRYRLFWRKTGFNWLSLKRQK